MHRLFTPLMRGFYFCVGGVLVIYAAFLAFTHSLYYKEHLYEKLLTGTRRERIGAAARLVVFDGEQQLLRALRSQSAQVRDVASQALWTVWLHAGGEKAYRLTRNASQAAEESDYRRALTILTDVVRQFPGFAEGWHQRATVFWQTGQFDDAIADARKAVKLNPGHFSAWQGLGLAQWHVGDWESACASWRQALRIAPHNPELRRLLQLTEFQLHQAKPPDRYRYDWI